jgi:hypothetical protein
MAEREVAGLTIEVKIFARAKTKGRNPGVGSDADYVNSAMSCFSAVWIISFVNPDLENSA